MPEPRQGETSKNIIGKQLIVLRHEHGLSQRKLAYQLQLAGLDVDKNVITRIETGKRHVTDIEIEKLCQLFHVSFEELIDGHT